MSEKLSKKDCLYVSLIILFFFTIMVVFTFTLNYYFTDPLNDFLGLSEEKQEEYDFEITSFIVGREYSFDIEHYPGSNPNIDDFIFFKTDAIRINHTYFSITHRILLDDEELQNQGVISITIKVSEISMCCLLFGNSSNSCASLFIVTDQSVMSCTVEANFISLSNSTYLYQGVVYSD